MSFRHKSDTNDTELSKYLYLHKENIRFDRELKRRSTCFTVLLTEKLFILKSDSNLLLNQRTEPIPKCRQENNYLLNDVK